MAVPTADEVSRGATPPRYLSRVITTGAIAMALTAPGQTAAVSVFVEPLIRELGISRSALSAAYLAGSLAGALVMPLLGQAIDRYGPRRIMAGIAAAFGAILMVTSTMSGVFGLTASFIGIRVSGQGALNLVATTTVAVYVHRRRGFALGLVSGIGTAGISLSPVLLERMISFSSWRTVWFAEGLAVWMLVIPAAWFLLPARPAPHDQVAVAASTDLGEGTGVAERAGADGAATAGAIEAVASAVGHPPPPLDWTLSRALRTGIFWVVASGVAACSLIGTGLTFQQQSLLGERGLSAVQAATIFVPQTLSGLVATFGLGWLADRYSDRLLIIATMSVLAGATLSAGWVHPGITAICYGIALGACGNGVRTLEAVAFPRIFGLRHLGAIRGVVHSVTVAASSFGPLLLALGREHADSYRPALLALATLPILVVVAAATVRVPSAAARPPRSGR